jgi:hypothetical protein
LQGFWFSSEVDLGLRSSESLQPKLSHWGLTAPGNGKRRGVLVAYANEVCGWEFVAGHVSAAGTGVTRPTHEAGARSGGVGRVRDYVSDLRMSLALFGRPWKVLPDGHVPTNARVDPPVLR